MKNGRIFKGASLSFILVRGLVLLMLCAVTPQTKGAILTVSSTLDGTPNSLRDAVSNAAAGDTIVFDAATNGIQQSLTLGEIVIDKDLTINGNGNLTTMIDGSLMSRILNIMPPANVVKVRDMAFSDGSSATSGGAIMNESVNLEISGCIISSSVASGALANEGGGAIANIGGAISIIDNSQILNNSAPGAAGSGGGILSTTGTINIINSSINNNSASRAGGGIEIIEGSLNITNSNLMQNLVTVNPAPGNGGAIHVSGASAFIVIETSTIDGNKAAQEGGGIWNQAGCVLNVSETQISNNEADGMAIDDGGGGIFNNGGIVAIADASAILSNKSNGVNAGGGGIFSTGGTVSVENSLISSNLSKYDGGGIYNKGVLDLNNATIEVNTADNHGGGLYNAGNTTMENSTINDNTAVMSGGGIDQRVPLAIISVESSFIINNTSGTCGGTCITEGTANIMNTILQSTLGAVGGDILEINVGAKSDLINTTVTQ